MPRVVLLFCLLLLSGMSSRAGEAAHPLDRTVSLDLWGAGLEEVAREIHAQSGVRVLFYRPELPGLGMADRVYLVTGRVSLRTVMECLAWRFSLRYRVAASGQIEVSRGYGWVSGEPVLGILRLEQITPRQDGGPERMERFLKELAKPLPLLAGEFSLTVERYPTPSHPESLRATTVLPGVLGEYLTRAVGCLSGDPGDYPLAAGGDGKRPFAVAGGKGMDWERFLGRRVATARGADMRGVLLGVARDAGVAFVFRGAPGGVGGGAAEFGATGFGVLTEELATRFGLGKRVFLSCGAVGFEGAGEGVETDARSREIFWDGLAVAGFDARAAADRAGGGAGLCAMLRREVSPWLWRDAVCGMQYSDETGRLVVVAPGNILEDVAARLRAPTR